VSAKAILLAQSLAVLSCSGGHGTPAASPPRAAAVVATPEPGGRPRVDRVTPLPQPLPEIVARVNGKPISMRTIRVLVNVDGERGAGRVGAENPAAYRNAVQTGIERELLIQEAERRKVVADDASIERHYNDALGRYKGDKPWAESLKDAGMDTEAYRNYLRVTYTIHALMAQVEAEAPTQVTDQELRAVYDANPRNFMSEPQVKASHILVRIPQGATAEQEAEARRKAEVLLQRVRAHEDFATLARQSSEDPASAPSGGDLGTLGLDQMPWSWRSVRDLKPGEVSDIIETPMGFDIVRVAEQIPSRSLAFGEAKEQVKKKIVNKKRQLRDYSFLSALRAKATIETFL
jgi:parvulin-like peptidyl-prolyl isomerase